VPGDCTICQPFNRRKWPTCDKGSIGFGDLHGAQQFEKMATQHLTFPREGNPMAVADGDPMVTFWLRSLEKGDPEAASRLWSEYFDRLAEVARQRIGVQTRRTVDGEDVALSVLDTLVRGATEGRFQHLQDRRQLWFLLLAITKDKSISRNRRETAKRRGSGQVVDGASLGLRARSRVDLTFDDLCGDFPTPDFIVELADQHRHLMSLLPDDTLRRIASAIMEGYSTIEIADQLAISVRTVQRKLKLIGAIWSNVLCQQRTA
jgi:DNA-directed RNA polymerase specialized sigma24 family protein